MKTEINWLDFTEENLKNCYKDVVEECLRNHEWCSTNILVIAKEGKKRNNYIYIRGEYKLMCSEMLIYYNEQIQNISFCPTNISNENIIKFVPMQEAIPYELKK